MYGSIKRNSISGYIALTIPALIVFTLIVYYPMVSSFFLAVTDWDGTSSHYNFVGLSNFLELLKDDYIKAGIWNTIEFTLFSTIIANFLAMLLALVLDKKLTFGGYLKAVFYIPCLFNTIVISTVFGSILQYEGIFNAMLSSMGLKSLALDWFGDIHTALPVIMATNTWQWLGFGSVIYLAGLQSIPMEYYEAAEIDGASKIGTFFKITLPMLMPSVTILTFLNLVGGLKLFELPFILTKGGPGYATETIGTVIYNLAFNQNKMGYASSISVVFFAMIVAVSALQLKITRSREVEL